MKPIFQAQTEWTNEPCYYVIAFRNFQRAWLAGPYRTHTEASRVFPRSVRWAVRQSGDPEAMHYVYQVFQHHDGQTRSILGEIQP
jgi:hypothetical protein